MTDPTDPRVVEKDLDEAARRIAGREPAVTALPCSLADLVTRAEGRPIYVTTGFAVRPALLAAFVGSFSREYPLAEFITARGLYRNADDRRRWPPELPTERDRFGAGIVVTRGEGHPEHADPFAGLAGEHVVGIYAGLEIENLVRLGRPVGWLAVVFPATYWFGRFAVKPFTEIQPSRYARLLPAPDAEPFRPAVGRWPFTKVVDA